MQPQFTWKWPALIATGLLVSLGALAACKATTNCLAGTPLPSKTPVSHIPLGEKKMSTAEKRQKVEHANEATFRTLVLESKVPVLVDFYADWCGPCRRIAPLLEELASETPSARIVKINVDDSPSLAAEYGVESIPSLKVFNRGEVTDEIVGVASKSQLRAMLGR